MLAAFPAERVYAGTYDISGGDISIDCENDPNPVITGTTTSNSVDIYIPLGCTATVTLSNVSIVLPQGFEESGGAAIYIAGAGNAVIELSGSNILKSGYHFAGIHKGNNGFLEIKGDGSLNVTGGSQGAGIGGGENEDGTNIKITGGTVSANGGHNAAGIGGGANKNGEHITISGGTVTATGGDSGAGIGGGGSGVNIEISGGTVTTTGGEYAAGIGGGASGNGADIEIKGGEVTATGGRGGAGIGGGNDGNAENIAITGGNVIAKGGLSGAGIGCGRDGDSCTGIRISDSAKVSVSGGSRLWDVYGIGPAIGTGGKNGGTTGTEVTPDTSGLYNTGYIRYYDTGTTAEQIEGGAEPVREVIGTFDPASESETPTEDTGDEKPEPAPAEDTVTVSDNKPMSVSVESKGDFKITYAHEIPFFGKGKLTPESFGGLTVSQGNATYKVTKIKVNKKKHHIQITGLQGADKATVKKVKKETKGSKGLPFKCNPYYVRDTDKVTPKFKKSGDLKSVKVFIDGKDYKVKKDEYSYDSSKKQILFKGNNLNGSYKTK